MKSVRRKDKATQKSQSKREKERAALDREKQNELIRLSCDKFYEDKVRLYGRDR